MTTLNPVAVQLNLAKWRAEQDEEERRVLDAERHAWPTDQLELGRRVQAELVMSQVMARHPILPYYIPDPARPVTAGIAD